MMKTISNHLISSLFLILVLLYRQEVEPKDNFVLWDDFREIVLKFYGENKIKGKHVSIKDKEIVEIAPKLKGIKVEGFGTFNGIKGEIKSQSQIIELDLLTPLEVPFNVTCLADVDDISLWEKLTLGSKVQFAGIIILVGTSYITTKPPVGVHDKRKQIIVIVISNIKPT
jgi:hypothetical protein